MMWVWVIAIALLVFALGVLSTRAKSRQRETKEQQERQRLKREKEETVELCERLTDAEGNRVWFCQTADGHRFRWAKRGGDEESWWSDDEGWRVPFGTARFTELCGMRPTQPRCRGNDHWVRHTERGEP